MVSVFFTCIMAVLTLFVWKGWISDEKSEIAADVVKGVICLGVGVFFGTFAGGYLL